MSLTIAMTGASGSIFARDMLPALQPAEQVHLVPSENSLRVLDENRRGYRSTSGLTHFSPGNRAKSLSVV
jgi:3-polyprenyl-4-hydroxybenzoate decarboxylase